MWCNDETNASSAAIENGFVQGVLAK